MVRAYINATVRGRPEKRSGRTNDRDWEFTSVPLLDSDFNKFEATIGDDADITAFGDGNVLDLVCDVRAGGGRLRVEIIRADVKSRPKSTTAA